MRVWAILAMVMAGGVVSLSAEGVTPQYHFTDLGSLGSGFSVAYGINSSGQITGYSYTAADLNHSHIFLYSGGTMSDLGAPFGGDAIGFAISGSGQIAGEADTSGGTPHGILYGSGITDLRPGGMGKATALNSMGQAAGTTTSVHPGIYSGGLVTDLGVPGEAWGINESAQVVGHYYTGAADPNGNSITHGFLYSGGPLVDLGNLGGTQARATAVNTAGQVVGWADTVYRDIFGHGGARHAFVYEGSSLIDLSPGLADSGADALNDNNEAVGWALGANAALYSLTQGLLGTLNGMTPDLSPGFTMQYATGINDNGWICGYGTTSGGQTHGFLLTPLPEPSAAFAFGTPVFVLLVRRKRRRVV